MLSAQHRHEVMHGFASGRTDDIPDEQHLHRATLTGRPRQCRTGFARAFDLADVGPSGASGRRRKIFIRKRATVVSIVWNETHAQNSRWHSPRRNSRVYHLGHQVWREGPTSKPGNG